MEQKTDNSIYLTNESFWDDFWRDIKLPALIGMDVQWYLALANEFLLHLPMVKGDLKLIELGCAPGRWLAWFHQNMGYQIAGCDSSPHGIQLTRENLRLNGITAELYQGDLFSDILPRETFDIVLSIGLIEHFDQPDRIIQRHLELLKPGGYLVLSVPNMAGQLNHFLLHQANMKRFLAAHNLQVMHKSFYEIIASKYHLETVFLDYIGGFDPGLITYNYVYDHPYPKELAEENRFQRLLKKLVFLLWEKKLFVIPPLVLLQRIFKIHPYTFTRFNASWCSHMILGIYRKTR